MTITRTPLEGTPAYTRGSYTARTIDVVTSVDSRNQGANATRSDTRRTQRTGDGRTYPTQMPQGTYSITERARAPSVGEGKYGEGNQGLVVNFSQMLQGIDPDTLEPIDGVTYQDSGYMIHITPYGYTDGCIGIRYDPNVEGSRERAVAEMEYIVNQYNDAIANGEKVKIVILD